MTNQQSLPNLIWTDPEINIRIYAQLCHLEFDQILPKPMFERFFRYAECVMHKLHATRYHAQAYAALEEAHHEQCAERFSAGDQSTYECFDLIFQLEAFLFQVKSSLDMLVKLMIPILGKRVKTQTYAAKGDHLINGLQQYMKDKSAQSGKVQEFIDMLQWAKTDWVERTVDIRDELNHHRGLTNYFFAPTTLPTGEVVPTKPKFKGLDTFEFMKDIFVRNLVFHQDFACLALSLVAPDRFFLMPETRQEAVAEFGDYAFCIKWAWGFSQRPGDNSESNKE
jgi:hypothetical protein